MQNRRLQRVSELLKRQLSQLVLRELASPEAGLISIQDVLVAGDLHAATVFVSIVGTAEQQQRGLALLREHRKRLQGLVGHAVVLKYTPELRFVLDDSVARGNRVLDILAEIETTLPAETAS